MKQKKLNRETLIGTVLTLLMLSFICMGCYLELSTRIRIEDACESLTGTLDTIVVSGETYCVDDSTNPPTLLEPR